MGYYIKNEMINKELRMSGVLLRTLLPYMKESTVKKLNYLSSQFVKGKWKSNQTNCVNDYITRVDGSKLRVLIVTPKNKKTKVPGLLWIHGGGYETGIPEVEKAYMERFILESGCTIISPDYRLSCEAAYPAALDDCYLALKWLKDHAEALGVRDDQLFVGGESAGGGLTAAVSLYARDQKEVKIAFQMPFYPMIDDRFITPSSLQNDAPVWNTKSNEIAWKQYLGTLYKSEAVPIYAAPSRCVHYEGLPPTCTFVGTIEPFYDETRAYVENLKNAGVEVHFKDFEGAYHAFDQVKPHANLTRQAVAFYMSSFEYALEHYFAEQI